MISQYVFIYFRGEMTLGDINRSLVVHTLIVYDYFLEFLQKVGNFIAPDEP